jgi:Ca2+-binding EF-hand superfamily protein
MKLSTFAALLLAAAPVAVAAAQPEAGDEPISKATLNAKLAADYADMDTDKNGKVTAAEVDARLVKSAETKIAAIKKERDAAFAKLDANNDGSVSRAEFDEKAKLPTVKQPDAKPFLAQFDVNKDGAISLEEFRTPTLANFARLDLNKDGVLTPAEMKTASTRKTTVKATPEITR